MQVPPGATVHVTHVKQRIPLFVKVPASEAAPARTVTVFVDPSSTLGHVSRSCTTRSARRRARSTSAATAARSTASDGSTLEELKIPENATLDLAVDDAAAAARAPSPRRCRRPCCSTPRTAATRPSRGTGTATSPPAWAALDALADKGGAGGAGAGVGVGGRRHRRGQALLGGLPAGDGPDAKPPVSIKLVLAPPPPAGASAADSAARARAFAASEDGRLLDGEGVPDIAQRARRLRRRRRATRPARSARPTARRPCSSRAAGTRAPA